MILETMAGVESNPKGQDFENPHGSDAIDANAKIDNSDSKDEEVSAAVGYDDAAAIPKGTIDPVYEAKARVLNHAVGPFLSFPGTHVTY